jgi:hypothetical protein
MSLLFVEPWHSYANGTSDLDQNGWNFGSPSGYLIASTNPRNGYGKYLDMGNVTPMCTHAVPGLTTFFANYSFLVTGSSNTSLFLVNESTTQHITVFYRILDNKVYVYRGNAGGTLLATSTLTISPNDWHHIECKFVINDSTGVVIVNIDGVEFINFSGDTRNGLTGVCDNFSFGGPSAATIGDEKSIGEIFIFDDSGSHWNDFQGNLACYPMPPTSDATPNDFTPSSGTDHYAMVDETVHDDDTTYLESSTDDHQEMFAPDSLPANVTDLHGVVLENVAKRTDVNDNTVENVLKVNTTETISTATGLSSDYMFSRNVYESNPDSAAAWVLADWPDIIFGVKNEVV